MSDQPPCFECGTTGGRIERDCQRPGRRSGRCLACYDRARKRLKRGIPADAELNYRQHWLTAELTNRILSAVAALVARGAYPSARRVAAEDGVLTYSVARGALRRMTFTGQLEPRTWHNLTHPKEVDGDEPTPAERAEIEAETVKIRAEKHENGEARVGSVAVLRGRLHMPRHGAGTLED